MVFTIQPSPSCHSLRRGGAQLSGSAAVQAVPGFSTEATAPPPGWGAWPSAWPWRPRPRAKRSRQGRAIRAGCGGSRRARCGGPWSGPNGHASSSSCPRRCNRHSPRFRRDRHNFSKSLMSVASGVPDRTRPAGVTFRTQCSHSRRASPPLPGVGGVTCGRLLVTSKRGSSAGPDDRDRHPHSESGPGPAHFFRAIHVHAKPPFPSPRGRDEPRLMSLPGSCRGAGRGRLRRRPALPGWIGPALPQARRPVRAL